ncbi:MAG TPA: glycoside hydrolase family 3 N-terminal domain-containing protein [Terriglobia bacterium]|nr:glycoside hydrolase family 3 N-terminal domain-containing protein [Terriglobia bacterium]
MGNKTIGLRRSFGAIGLAIGLASLVAAPARAQFKLTTDQQAWVDKTLAGMSLDDKVGQLMFAVTSGVFTPQNSDEFQTIKDNIQKYHVGGYHIEGGGGNPASTALLVSRMQQLAGKIPLLITADLEGGAGSPFPGATRFPRGMAIGATDDTQYAYDAAHFTALEAKAMGISVNFYPVVDVNNNPKNPIINVRSFGEDPAKVGEFGAAYVKGTEEAGVIATAKHFPGHGDTSVDSHLELPVLDFDRARLNLIELPPFEAAIRAGVDAVMVGHIDLAQIEKTPGLPASLSPAVITGLLRNDLGFKGLVFTDGLPMHAITEHFGAAQAVVMAIEAGADVALEPADIPKSFEALKAAANKGDISQERLDASVRRLLEAKAWEGLPSHATPDLSALDTLVGTHEARQKAEEIMDHAVTLVKDDQHAIPLKLDSSEDVLLLNFTDAGSGEAGDSAGETFRDEFVRRHPQTVYVNVPPTASDDELDLIERLLPRYHTVVVSTTVRIGAYKRGGLGLNETQLYLLREVSRHDGPTVVASFGSPYVLDDVPDLPGYAAAYETYPGAEAAMVRALFGEIPFQGKLPVTVSTFPVGSGLKR